MSDARITPIAAQKDSLTVESASSACPIGVPSVVNLPGVSPLARAAQERLKLQYVITPAERRQALRFTRLGDLADPQMGVIVTLDEKAIHDALMAKLLADYEETH